MVICLNYGHFEKKLRSVIVSQNHYLNRILDIHPLSIIQSICAMSNAFPQPLGKNHQLKFLWLNFFLLFLLVYLFLPWTDHQNFSLLLYCQYILPTNHGLFPIYHPFQIKGGYLVQGVTKIITILLTFVT